MRFIVDECMPGRQCKSLCLTLVSLILLLSACTPALPTTAPAPTSPPTAAPAPTRPPTETPLPPPTAPPTSTPKPTPTPPPPPPLGLSRLWAWTADDIINDFLVRDFDGGGFLDIAVASYDRRVYLVDAWGGQYWSWDSGASVFCLEAADLDGDGLDEILAGSADGTLSALDSVGELRWQAALTGRVTAIAAIDLDSDGRPEILTGARPQGAWALDREGSVLWQQDTLGAPTALLSFASGQNQLLILSTEEGAVQALDPAGVPLWQHTGSGYIRGLATFEGGALAGGRDGRLRLWSSFGEAGLDVALPGPIPLVLPVDLDGDGRDELLAGTQSGLQALDGEGRPLWSLSTEQGVWALAFPDLEGDGQPEIAVGTDGGQILLLDVYGRLRGHTWVPFRVHGLLAADLDGDGRDELLARASNHLYAFAASPEGEPGEQQPFIETLEDWPADTPLLRPAEGQVVLAAVGDIMIGRAVEPRMLMYGAVFPFEPLLPLLQGADITTGNLEGVLAFHGVPLQKSYTFRGHPDLVGGLEQAGFDLLTLANNHAMDFGQAGLDETIAVLNGAGIAVVGAGAAGYDPTILEVNGLTIAFLGRTAAIAPQEGVAWAEADELRQAVARARQEADLVVVHLHAGYEYWMDYESTQQRLAQAAADGGAALVIGHHSHAPQPVEWIGETLVAYSLGDFVFDIDDHDIARDAVVLRVLLSREGVVGVEWIPARIVDDVQPRPLAGTDGRPQIERLFEAP